MKKGFTLIELLAVIVILSVITLITIPMITNVIEESKKKALVSSVEAVLDSTEYFTMSHETGVYEFLFDEEHKGSTIKGEKLDYRGTIDGEGKLYLDKEGNTSICISNNNYYVYKNYNSGIVVGNKKTGNCIIGFDALTNKYVAMLDNGTGQVSNVYSKDEINNLIDNLANTYATKEELNNLDTHLENLSTTVSNNEKNIEQLTNKVILMRSHVGMIIQSTTLDTEEKVIEIYGGTSWSKIEGKFLLGESDSYAINSEGGEATHTLTVNEMPKHTHTYTGTNAYPGAPSGGSLPYVSGNSTWTSSSAGGSQPHNNMPPYKVVYIWERTA